MSDDTVPAGTQQEEAADGAEWLPGKRLNGSDSEETVMEWVDSLGLDIEKEET